MRRPLGRDPAIFREVSPDRVDELSSLPHQQITGSKYQPRRLLLFALYGHEPHARPLRGFANRLGIDRVVLLSLYERFYVGRRDQPYLVAKLSELASPVMSTATRLQRDGTTRLDCKEIQ